MSNPLNLPVLKTSYPIADAFKSVGAFITFAGSVVTALVGWSVLTSVQGDAITGLLGAIPGVVTLVTQLLQAFAVIKRATPQTTPADDAAVVVNGHRLRLLPNPDEVADARRSEPGPLAA